MCNEIDIISCKNCPFFMVKMDGMECNHPFWKDKGAYANMIITQNDIQNSTISEKCPLRIEDLVITYKINK